MIIPFPVTSPEQKQQDRSAKQKIEIETQRAVIEKQKLRFKELEKSK
tara:strand:- start:364 stop:504 length:141 start_codon:yes stop_codon:yes gene_type:complete